MEIVLFERTVGIQYFFPKIGFENKAIFCIHVFVIDKKECIPKKKLYKKKIQTSYIVGFVCLG